MTPEEKGAIRKRASDILSKEHDKVCDALDYRSTCCGFELAVDVIRILGELERMEEIAGQRRFTAVTRTGPIQYPV